MSNSRNNDNNYNNSYTTDVEIRDDSLKKTQQLEYLLYRIIPFWPLIVVLLSGGGLAGYLFLRYATPLYQVKARMVVNDDTQEKSANLQEIFTLDTRNLSSETERELEILRSSDILKKVASQLYLNVEYYQQGNIKTGQAFDNTPFTLVLQSPDSVKAGILGSVKIVKNQIQFNGELFPVDTFINTAIGNIKWHINERFLKGKNNVNWSVNVISVPLAARKLKDALSVAPISKSSSIFDLAFTDLFPARGVIILNKLISVYGTSAIDYKSRIYENTKRFLDGRLNLIAEELNGVEKNIQDYKTSERIVDLSTEGSLYLNKLKAADTKIGEIDVQLDVLKQIELYVSRRNNTNSQIPATLGISDPVLTALLNQLYQTEFELDKLKQLSGDKNPQVEVYEAMLGKLKPSIISSINNLKVSIETSRKRLTSDNESLNIIINKIPLKERLLLDLSRQQGIKNAIYTFLLQKREESAIASASIVPNYRVIEIPEYWGQVAPKKQNYYATALTISLVLAALLIYLIEFSSSKLLFRSQIENTLPIPIVGELIYQSHIKGSPIVVGEGIRTLIAEQFRELRTNLNFVTANTGDKCKVILITSSIPSEGKSFVAINSSVSLSLTGSKVLLMEFDLRRPKISKPLGIKREPGITNFLTGNATEGAIIQPHAEIPNFFIMASGPIPPNPAELIGTARLEELMKSLKQQFDYIIIDSPPAASVTDAKLLARYADVTLYIIRHNFTGMVFLKLINDIYQKNAMPNMNIIFNGVVNKKVLGYGYGYGYGFGFGYGYADKQGKMPFYNRILNWIKAKLKVA